MTQENVVFLVVAAAVAYLVRTWWKASRGEKGCGGCKGACGKPGQSTLAAPAAPIQIQMNGRALQLSPRESRPAPQTQTSHSDSPSH